MEDSIRLNLLPDWNKIEEVRNNGTKFLIEHGFDEDIINALIMILSELVENSIKYGIYDDQFNEIKIKLNINRNLVTIEVNNPVNELIENHLKRLDKTIQWIVFPSE